jgi:hypothetical protein
VFGLLLLVSLLQYAPFIWLSGRICNIPTATWRRSLGMSLILCLMLIPVAAYLRFGMQPASLASALGQLCGVLLIVLVIGSWLTKALLKTTGKKAFATICITLPCGGGVCLRPCLFGRGVYRAGLCRSHRGISHHHPRRPCGHRL